MHPKSIGVFFLALLTSAEVVQTRSTIRRERAQMRLSQQLMHEHSSLASTTGAEQDWQEANQQCVENFRGAAVPPGSRGCTNREGEHVYGMCIGRPLPNDKSMDETCRLSDEYMMQPDKVLGFVKLHADLVKAKAAKFRSGCGHWWTSFNAATTTKKMCARRQQHMLSAVNFLAKAQTPEVLEQLSAEEGAELQRTYEETCAVLGTDPKKQLATQQLIDQVKGSAELEQHPKIVAERMVEVLQQLHKGTPEEQQRAEAAIQNGEVIAAVSKEELDREMDGVERVMTTEEQQDVMESAKHGTDALVEAMGTELATVSEQDQQVSAEGDSALIQTSDDNVAAAVGYAILIVLAVVAAIFAIKFILGAIAVWIFGVLCVCTGRALPFKEQPAATGQSGQTQVAQKNAWPPSNSGLVEVESQGLVVEEEKGLVLAETAVASRFPWGQLFKCYAIWIVMPFVLIGRAIVWVVRKVSGSSNNNNAVAQPRRN